MGYSNIHSIIFRYIYQYFSILTVYTNPYSIWKLLSQYCFHHIKVTSKYECHPFNRQCTSHVLWSVLLHYHVHGKSPMLRNVPSINYWFNMLYMQHTSPIIRWQQTRVFVWKKANVLSVPFTCTLLIIIHSHSIIHYIIYWKSYSLRIYTINDMLTSL